MHVNIRPTHEAEAAEAYVRQLIRTFCQIQINWPASLQEGELLSQPYFNAVARQGRLLQSHGMAKGHPLKSFDNLLMLFKAGIDRNITKGRRGYLDSAPLTAPYGEGLIGMTASGTAYKDGAFILVACALVSRIDNITKIAAVLVNQAIAESAPELPILLQKLLPDTIMVRAYSDIADVIQHANRLPLETACFKAATRCPWYGQFGMTEGPAMAASPHRPNSPMLPAPPKEIIL